MTTLVKSPISPFEFKNVVPPNTGINPSLVNVDNSSYSGGFGSIETSRQFSLNPVPISGAQAANSSIMKGGRKNKKSIKMKIKNIVNKYKKMGKKLTLKKLKRKLSKVFRFSKSKSKKQGKTAKRRGRGIGKNGASRKMRGGSYHQYMGGVPNTPVYSTGGYLPPNLLGLANPVPFEVLQNSQNCSDSYNHFTHTGKQVW